MSVDNNNNTDAPAPTGAVDETALQENEVVLGMSDEDFLKLDPASFLDVPDTKDDDTDKDDDDSDDQGTDGEDETSGEDDDTPAGDDDGSGSDDPHGDDGDDSDTDGDDSDGEDDSDDGDDTPVGAQAFFDTVTAPFVANGKPMQVQTAEEAVRLMQMGANYNKKMVGMRPHMKILKTLENAKIGESELNFLIDLKNLKPEAITQLLQDSKIDPMDIDLKSEKYTAEDHTVSDGEIALDEVLAEIRGTETYDRIVNVVTNEWDAASKQVISQEPQLLKMLNDHMANGVYDVISTEVNRERTFGRLDGMSDLKAYDVTGKKLEAARGFDHIFKPKDETPPPTPKVDDAKTKAEAIRAAKRKAAGPAKTKKKSGDAPEFNPLSMSDDEFIAKFGSA